MLFDFIYFKIYLIILYIFSHTDTVSLLLDSREQKEHKTERKGKKVKYINKYVIKSRKISK